jgi:hypothetical protein
MSKIAVCAFAAAFLGLAGAASAESPRPADARLYFIEPANGAVIDGKVIVKFGLSGMDASKANIGHRHLLIDVDPPSGAMLNRPMPHDSHMRHLGGGQAGTAIDLPPGKHSLQLIVGDSDNVPHDPPLMSQRIEIEVKEPPQP